MYLRDLAGVPPLTKDEENSLLQHVRLHDEHADAAAMRLIEANLALVVSIAERYRSAGIDFVNLLEKGNLALYKAVTTFHESGSENFSEHAAQCVEKALSNAQQEPE